MDDNERFRRRTQRRMAGLSRLGVTNIRCICGETRLVCFEADHVDRRSNSDVVWGLCKNCHAARTDRHNSEHPPVSRFPANPFERYGHMLLGAADYLEFILQRLRQLAELMFKLAGKGIVIEE